MSDIERRLASIEVMLEELASRPVPPHAEHHEMVGMDTVRLSVQNSGSQLNRQRTLNFGAGLTASESSSNKRIDVGVSLAYYTADAVGDLTLTTSYQDVGSATVTLAAIGTYLIWCTSYCKVDCTGGGGDNFLYTILVLGGVTQTGAARLYSIDGGRAIATVGQHWVATTTGADTIAKLQASKAYDRSTCQVYASGTRITALRIA